MNSFLPSHQEVAPRVALSAGLAAGQLGGRLGSEIAEQLGVSPLLGRVTLTFVSHFVASTMVKVAFDAVLTDGYGGPTEDDLAASANGAFQHALFNGGSDLARALGGGESNPAI